MSAVPTATMTKFGYPRTLVAETPHWAVLVRPKQPTLGSLVVAARQPASAFGQLGVDAFAGLQPVVARVEAVLRDVVGYERINHLMLMMVDPDVHFHVIPRYDGTREFEGVTFPDPGWPGPPVLGDAVDPDPAVLDRLVARLRAAWDARATGTGA